MTEKTENIDHSKLSGSLRRDSVKKNVAAIHISGKLTLLQRKLSNVLLLNAYDELMTARSHSIDARTLCMMIGYNSNDIETLREALRSLAETVAEWDMLDEDGKQEWGVSSLLSYAKLKSGVCEYAYSPALSEKLHEPKVFALINLNIQRRFTSGHGLALYENCYRFQRTGSTGWWPLDLFRRLMGVDESNYYASFKHLNAKIIKPAVAEVNKTSNIILTPEFKKKGRAVTDIRFLIKENPQLAMFDIDDGDAVRQSDVYKQLRAQNVADRLARQWIAEHGENAIKEKLDYLSKRDDVRLPERYLAAALSNSAKNEESPVAPTPPRKIDLPDPETLLREEEHKDRARKFEAVKKAFESRNPTQRDALKRLFLNSLVDEIERQNFASFEWNSGLIASKIFKFWEEIEPEIFNAPEPKGINETDI